MNIFEKINKVRTEILKQSLTKDKKGYSYNYIDLPQIEPVITEECSKVGLLTIVDFPDNRAVMRIFDTEYKDGGLSSFEISVPCDYSLVDIKGSQPIQKVGGMMTYMRRYLYMTLFAISEHDAVEGIGKISQEVAEEIEDDEPVEETVEEEDPHRKELIDLYNKNLPDYLPKVITYCKGKTINDVPTEELERIYKKKIALVNKAKGEKV